MGVISDAARSPGDIMHRLAALERALADLQSARSLESAAVGAGGLRIHGGGRLLLEDPIADRFIRAREGRFEFGRLSDGTDNPVAFLNAKNQDLSLVANFNAFVAGANQVSIDSANGHVFVTAPTGSFVIGEDIDRPIGGDLLAFVQGVIQLLSNDQIVTISQGHTSIVAEDGGSIFLDAEGQIAALSDDAIFLESAIDQVLISHQVAGGTANAAWSGDLIYEISSSRRYKTDIRDYRISPRTVLDLKARTWRDKSEVERDPGTDRWHVGFIAEELDEAGLTDFVDYDADGQPKAVTYDRLCVALLEHNRHLQAQVDALTAWAASQGYTPPPEPEVEPTRIPKRGPAFAANLRPTRPTVRRPMPKPR